MPQMKTLIRLECLVEESASAMNSIIEEIKRIPSRVRDCTIRSIVVRGDTRGGELEYTFLDAALSSTYADGTPAAKGREPIREQKRYRYERGQLVEMPMGEEKVCSDF